MAEDIESSSEGPAGHRPVVAAVVKSFPPAFRSGGPGRSVAALIEALDDRLDFRVVTSTDDNGHDLREDGVGGGVWMSREGTQALALDPSLTSSVRLVRELRDLDPDVLYLNSFFNPVFAIAPLLARRLRLLRPARTIIAPRGEFSPGALSLKASKKGRFLRLFRALGLGRGVVWQATSDLEAELIRATVGAAIIEVAPVVRQLDVADTAPTSSESTVRLVLLSKIDRMKNLETAVEAIAAATADVHLTIAGPVKEADYWAECNERIETLGVGDRITYHGAVDPDRVSGFLSGFDGFVLPTRGENFGHAILEALAAGLPTIISDTTQWNRLAPAGAGWVCGVDDVTGFSSAIDDLAASDAEARAEMSRAATALARTYVDDSGATARNAALFGLDETAPRHPRIALVHYAFPVTTQTFHHRRARVMLEEGVLEGIHYVNDAGGTVEQRSAGILAVASRVRRPSIAGGAASLLRDSRGLLVEGLSTVASANGEGGRAGFLWQAVQGAALGRQLRSGQATHVHAPFATAPATVALFAAAVANLPLSIEVHSPISAARNPDLLGWKLSRAASVFTISAYTSDLVRQIRPEIQPVVVHCGLDLDETAQVDPVAVEPVEGNPAGWNTERPSAGPFEVVAVGSLGPKKGHRILIEASALLAQRLPHAVAIVGEGRQRNELEAQIAATRAPVELLGERTPEETARIRGSARVGVLAAVETHDGDADGVPVALMEFMAAGVPVVSTRVAGIPELLDHGRAGSLVESADATALAVALERTLTDEVWRARLAAAGRCRIADLFDNHTETMRLIAELGGAPVPDPIGADS